MPPFDDEPSWEFTDKKEVQKEHDVNSDSDYEDGDGGDNGDGSVVVETVSGGDESSSEESTERGEESQEEDKSSEETSDHASSSEDLKASGFGGLGSSMSSSPNIPIQQGYKDDPESGVLEHFHDEPDGAISSLHYAISADSSDGFGGDLEPGFVDEYEDSGRESLARSSSIKSIRSDVPRIWNRSKYRLGILLFCLLLAIFAICFGVTKMLVGKGSENDEKAKVANSSTPVASSTVVVPVHLDGYLRLGGIIFRDVEVQHDSTLLVEDGYHHTAAVSIVEFDTSSSLTTHPLNNGSIKSAVVSLTVADVDIENVSKVVTLYARLYPNDIGTTPDFDINYYGCGALDFDQGWISFELHMGKTSQAEIDILQTDPRRQVEIDVTNYFQKQYFPMQQNKDVWDNVKILIAHDNTDADRGARVRFHSSESESEAEHPRLTINLEPPGLTPSKLTSSLAPSISPSPTVSPTASAAPSRSIQPSGSPSKSPTLRPTSSASPTYNPTLSPEPTIESYPVCSVCGALVLDTPKTKVSNSFRFDSGRGDASESSRTTCGALQLAGLNGEIRPKQCKEIQAKATDVCCRKPEDGIPSFKCNLCGGLNEDGGIISNPDVVVQLPVIGEARTCGQYQTQADLGLIPKSICDRLQPHTASYCCTILL